MPTFSPVEFGRRLRSARTIKGLEPEEVETRTGVAKLTIQKWERGAAPDKHGPGIFAVRRLATEYGVSVDWLLGLTDDEKILPPGYVMVDLGVVDCIRRAKRARDLGAYLRQAWYADIPAARQVYPPNHPRWLELQKEVEEKLESLGLGKRRR